MKNNIFNVFLGALVVACGLQIAMIDASPARGKPALLGSAKSYTIGYLLQVINSNNPNGNSNFILPSFNGSVVMNAACWATNSAGVITNLNGSISAVQAGLANLINSNLNTTVSLSQDSTLINHLANTGVLTPQNRGQYQQICLYFTLNGYRFYINDPYPGQIVRSFGVVRSPAQSIINKWNFNASA